MIDEKWLVVLSILLGVMYTVLLIDAGVWAV